MGGVDRDHDGHVVVQDLDGEILALPTADFHVLDLHDLARTMVRVDDLIADSVQDQPPPGLSSSRWRPRGASGDGRTLVMASLRLARPSTGAPLRKRRASVRGMNTVSKPTLVASVTRRCGCPDDRNSPVRPISPNTAALRGSATPRSAEATARATAKSAAGSSMRTPPTMLTKTSAF